MTLLVRPKTRTKAWGQKSPVSLYGGRVGAMATSTDVRYLGIVSPSRVIRVRTYGEGCLPASWITQ
jgi:hypothetical protein